MATETINIRFPALNKNGDLADNDARIAGDPRVSRCKVVKTLVVPPAVYDALGATLLDNNAIWEKIGGAETDDPDCRAVLDHEGEERGAFLALQKAGLIDRFRQTCYTFVVEVKTTGKGREPFYVNTEGYDYARYVGRAA